MLARLSLPLNFYMAIPRAAPFRVWGYRTGDYEVVMLPPEYTPEQPALAPASITIDGEPAVLANVLRIDFRKDAFDRQSGTPFDPPTDLMVDAVSFLLSRLRHATQAPQVRLPGLPWHEWQLEYTNDDGTPLQPESGLTRGHGATPLLSVSFVTLTPGVWSNLYDLPADYEPPPWETLLLDAVGELPNVGTAVVLSSTALEVFIATVLNQLAEHRKTPGRLWSWINQRPDYRQEPTVEEQYDVLLEIFTGHSLKEDSSLWSALKNLKQARNRFVHEGVVRIGGDAVGAGKAAELVTAAKQIVAKIRDWLPDTIKWPAYESKAKVEVFSKTFPR